MTILLIQNKAETRTRRSHCRMIRDSAIAALLTQRMLATNTMRGEAIAVLLDLCRDGMNDAEISVALTNAAPHMPESLVREIRVVAEATGIAL